MCEVKQKKCETNHVICERNQTIGEISQVRVTNLSTDRNCWIPNAREAGALMAETP